MAKASKASESAASLMSANARFKQTFGAWLWGGLVVATVLHFGLFQLFPELTASDVRITMRDTPVMPLPEIDIPEPPEPIPQPKAPVVGDTDPLEDVTIPRTTLEDNPVGLRPPAEEVRAGEEPGFRTPYTVKPELRNRAEAIRIVERHYPGLLKDAGIGGQVDVWLLIDTTGVVRSARVQRSSGNSGLDEAALTAAREFRFTPALNRDRKVSVWLEIPITFSVKR